MSIIEASRRIDGLVRSLIEGPHVSYVDDEKPHTRWFVRVLHGSKGARKRALEVLAEQTGSRASADDLIKSPFPWHLPRVLREEAPADVLVARLQACGLSVEKGSYLYRGDTEEYVNDFY